jgi:hypothetical protein
MVAAFEGESVCCSACVNLEHRSVKTIVEDGAEEQQRVDNEVRVSIHELHRMQRKDFKNFGFRRLEKAYAW